jgi:undecaprenyl-diphosphatase
MSDFSLEHDLNRYAGHHPTADTILRHIAESQIEVGAFVLALILLGLLLRRRRLFLAGVTALVAAGIAVVGNVVVAHIWYRPRPFVSHPNAVHLIVHHPADASFPSDHSAALAAIAVALVYFLRPLGLLAVVWALSVGFARVYVGEHYPGDVLGGYAIGILAGLLVLAAVRSRLFATRIVPRLSFLTP